MGHHPPTVTPINPFSLKLPFLWHLVTATRISSVQEAITSLWDTSPAQRFRQFLLALWGFSPVLGTELKSTSMLVKHYATTPLPQWDLSIPPLPGPLTLSSIFCFGIECVWESYSATVQFMFFSYPAGHYHISQEVLIQMHPCWLPSRCPCDYTTLLLGSIMDTIYYFHILSMKRVIAHPDHM